MDMTRFAAPFCLAVATLWLASCASVAPPAGPPSRSLDTPTPSAATTAHPLATAAALRMLDAGGSSIDAAIAAQMVLGLVEAQSSGIGGGTLVLYYDAGSNKLETFDGLSAAPASTTAALTVGTDGSVLKSADVQRGGRSVGVPGTLPVLKQIHARFGKLPWATLFAPAIELAESGFPMAAYMHGVLSAPTAAADHPDLLPIFFDAQGQVLPVGALVRNPAYAHTLRRVAAEGPASAWGEKGIDFLASVQRGPQPSLISAADLANYRPETRDALCAPFLVYKVCTMAPPSFGGVVVLQVLQMLESRTTAAGTAGRFDFDNSEFVHFYAESGRLAQADRRFHVGDPAFTPVPSADLVAADYVRARALEISPARTTPTVGPGTVLKKAAQLEQAPEAAVADATSQLAIVDKAGSALAMTTTNNLNFGSRLVAGGVVLNNALTNFTGVPRPGQAAPNRMEGGKRPVTSMAPTIVFDRAGLPVVVGGSAGGGQIVDYIAQALVEMLANGRTPAQALARGHVSTAITGKLQLEAGTPAAAQADALRAKGHSVDVVPLPSGLGFLQRRGDGWIGAADPRRDGVARGQ